MKTITVLLLFMLALLHGVFSSVYHDPSCGTSRDPCRQVNVLLAPCNSSFLPPSSSLTSAVFDIQDSSLARCACTQQFYDNLTACVTCYATNTNNLTVAPLNTYKTECANDNVVWGSTPTNASTTATTASNTASATKTSIPTADPQEDNGNSYGSSNKILTIIVTIGVVTTVLFGILIWYVIYANEQRHRRRYQQQSIEIGGSSSGFIQRIRSFLTRKSKFYSPHSPRDFV